MLFHAAHYNCSTDFNGNDSKVLERALSMTRMYIHVYRTLQMKGWWESNINVWFLFMYSQKWNCAALLFPNQQNYNVLSPNFRTHVSVTDLYIPRICLPILLFCCSKIGRPIPGIYKLLSDTWKSQLGTRPCRYLGIHELDFGTVYTYKTCNIDKLIK